MANTIEDQHNAQQTVLSPSHQKLVFDEEKFALQKTVSNFENIVHIKDEYISMLELDLDFERQERLKVEEKVTRLKNFVIEQNEVIAQLVKSLQSDISTENIPSVTATTDTSNALKVQELFNVNNDKLTELAMDQFQLQQEVQEINTTVFKLLVTTLLSSEGKLLNTSGTRPSNIFAKRSGSRSRISLDTPCKPKNASIRATRLTNELFKANSQKSATSVPNALSHISCPNFQMKKRRFTKTRPKTDLQSTDTEDELEHVASPKHSIEKSFECTKCNKAFDYKWQMVHHSLKQHKPENRSENLQSTSYDVPQPESESKVNSPSSGRNPQRRTKLVAQKHLKNRRTLKYKHGRDMTKPSGYVCFCGTPRFLNLESLRKHLDQFKKAKMFTCLFCPKRFVKENNLRLHMEKEHNKVSRTQQASFICHKCRTFYNTRGQYLLHHSLIHCGNDKNLVQRLSTNGANRQF